MSEQHSPPLDISWARALSLLSPVPLTAHPAAVYLDSLSPGSKRTMHHALNTIAQLLTQGLCDALTLNWAALRYQHTAAVRSVLKERYAAATANKMLSALRRVLLEALRLDLMEAKDYAKAIDFEGISGDKKLRGRALTQAEIAALMQVCQADPTPIGARDAALIAILRGAGLRRAEVVKLQLKDYHPLTGELEVAGKRNRERSVYLSQEARRVVGRWLSIRGHHAGALLHPFRKGGSMVRRSLGDQAVFLVVQRRAQEAGVAKFSPHDFRRTFCSDLLDAQVDIVTVQKLAGHASPLTTAQYDRRGEETKRRAVEHLQLGTMP